MTQLIVCLLQEASPNQPSASKSGSTSAESQISSQGLSSFSNCFVMIWWQQSCIFTAISTSCVDICWPLSSKVPKAKKRRCQKPTLCWLLLQTLPALMDLSNRGSAPPSATSGGSEPTSSETRGPGPELVFSPLLLPKCWSFSCPLDVYSSTCLFNTHTNQVFLLTQFLVWTWS